MNKLIELLSPAGDPQIFKAVVDAGADAVYFGGSAFGARAYATNFTLEEARECIRYAHLRNTKAFLTVNTLLKNTEIEIKLYEYLKSYYEAGIDAFIIQDLGVLSMIKEYFPDVDIHASTQMSITTEYGAKLLSDLGAKRIVTAREISLSEIKKIRDINPELEIESFIHGALCYSYSGQCLMSSMIGGRSGNRGRCAGTCRLNYTPLDKNKKALPVGGEFPLSLKDFCCISQLPQMIESGVNSFKIEGRMKSKEYAAGVTGIYRKNLDKLISEGAKNYSVDKNDIQSLLDLGNRSGFTNTYLYKHNDKDMISFQTPGHTSNKENKTVLEFPVRKQQIDISFYGMPNENAVISASLGDISVSCISENTVDFANAKATTAEDIRKPLLQLGNTPFSCSNPDIFVGENAFIQSSLVKNMRRNVISLLENELIEKKKIGKTKAYTSGIIDANSLDNSSVFKKVIITVQTLEQLDAVNAYRKKNDFCDVAVPLSLIEDNDFSDYVLYLSPVIRNDKADYIQKIKAILKSNNFKGIIACSMDELGLLEEYAINKDKIILDSRIYSFSNKTVEFLYTMGYTNNTIPYELSQKELSHRYNNFSYMPIYGRIPVMISSNCMMNSTTGCNRKNDIYYLKDRLGNSFVGRCFCDNCLNILYNCKIYEAMSKYADIKNLNAFGVRIDFTFESFDEVSFILKEYEKLSTNTDYCFALDDATRGHLNRGVE